MIMASFTISPLLQSNIIQISLSYILTLLLLQKLNSNGLFSGATEVQGLRNLNTAR